MDGAEAREKYITFTIVVGKICINLGFHSLSERK